MCRKAGVTSQEGITGGGSRTWGGGGSGKRNVRELNDKSKCPINLHPNQNSSFKKGGGLCENKSN